jgi:hypothetical protein
MKIIECSNDRSFIIMKRVKYHNQQFNQYQQNEQATVSLKLS